MRDYEKLFVTNLHSKLKKKIHGSVYCEINERDELYVRIRSSGDIYFEKRVDNFSDRFVSGYSTEYAMYDIINEYKKKVISKYFY